MVRQGKASLEMLTWNSSKTLKNMLTSIRPILDCFDEKIVICQGSIEKEIDICVNYGLTPARKEVSSGIQDGIESAAIISTNERMLFLEYDVILDAGTDEAKSLFDKLIIPLECNEIQFVFLRRIRQIARHKYVKYRKVQNGLPTQKLKKYIRWNDANAVAAKLIRSNIEANIYNPYLESMGRGLFKTSFCFCKRKNRSIFMNQSFFSKTVIPFAENNPTDRTVNGWPDLEHRINCSGNRYRWRNNEFPNDIHKPGLFNHQRLDRDRSDRKWAIVNPKDDGKNVSVSN